jgi:ethanolamine utilization protein EutN
MILCRVIGQVWATTRNPWLDGRKLLLVRPLVSYRLDPPCDHLVAVDPVGAETGQDVVVCIGLPARWALGDTRCPVEASIAAIVDRVEVSTNACESPAFRFPADLAPANLEVGT